MTTTSEKQMAAWWQAGGVAGQVLVADDDSRWRGRYPGRPNHEAGPDFVEAVLEQVGGPVVRGAVVELHRRASDWEQHCHTSNPRYGRVTLHVVQQDDRLGHPTLAADGRHILRATVEVAVSTQAAGYSKSPRCGRTTGRWHYGCRLDGAAGRDRRRACQIVSVAGDARLAWLTRLLRRDLRQAGALVGGTSAVSHDLAEQVLYEWIADALGFSQNREPMRALARQVPLATLRGADKAAPQQSGSLATAAAQLLEAAGGLKPPSGHAVERQLPFVLQGLPPAAEPPANGRGRGRRDTLWQVDRSRPGNAPVCRIVALAALATSWPPAGLGPTVVALLTRAALAPGAGAGHRPIWVALADLVRRAAPPAALMGRPVWPGGWWQGQPPAALIGDSRAADIVVNVFLPYGLALASGPPQSEARELAQAVRRVYLAHPRLADNWIIRLMGERTGLRPRTAREQQGLIWLYEQHSHGLYCDRCPLGVLPSAGSPQHPQQSATEG